MIVGNNSYTFACISVRNNDCCYKFYSMRAILVCSLFFCFWANGFSQSKTVENQNQFFLNYFNTTRIANKWALQAEAHYRTNTMDPTDVYYTSVGAATSYYLNDDSRFTIGFNYLSFAPATGHKNIAQPELRPWQQFSWINKYPRVKVTQWVRLEERNRHKILNDDALAAGYNFNYRARYNCFVLFAMGKKPFHSHTCSFTLSNEIFLNFGKQIVYNTFDQNRAFIGITYHTSKRNNFMAGYSNIFQQLSNGNKYRDAHIARIAFFHNVDLRKKIQAHL